jgi:hypothetical protein
VPSDLLTEKTNLPAYPTGGDVFEAYWRTVMTDCVVVPNRRLTKKEILEYGVAFASLREEVRTQTLDVNERKGIPPKSISKIRRNAYQITKMAWANDLPYNWRFAEVEGGSFAMIPWEFTSNGVEEAKEGKVGDSIVAVDGGKVPRVLRQKRGYLSEETEEWEVVGTAYVHGMMDGLASEWAENGKLSKRDFRLV